MKKLLLSLMVSTLLVAPVTASELRVALSTFEG